jgi:hypothetical protein
MASLTLPLTENQEKVVAVWKEKMAKKIKRANGGAKAKDPTEGEVLVALANELIYGAVVSRKLETQIVVAKRKAKNAALVDLLPGLKVTGRPRGSYKKKETNKTN